MYPRPKHVVVKGNVWYICTTNCVDGTCNKALSYTQYGAEVQHFQGIGRLAKTVLSSVFHISTQMHFCRMELKMKTMMNYYKLMKPRRNSLAWFQNLEIEFILRNTGWMWEGCWCRSVSEKAVKDCYSGLLKFHKDDYSFSFLHLHHAHFSSWW
jgi:hypothetical protein